MPKGRIWTTAELAQLKREAQAGTPNADIAAAHNRSIMAIKAKKNELQLGRVRTGWTEREDAYIRKCAGMVHSAYNPLTWRDVSRYLGRGYTTTRQRAVKLGVTKC